MTQIRGLDEEACYRAVSSRDRRFDGVFYTAVSTTGIYCRPSCPAITPKRGNVTFHPSAASAQLAGYRACKRCLPDATPGSPAWDVAADAAARAMRLIADGVVEREGIGGLAARMGFSERHLNRLVTAAYGAGPLAIARSRRAQAARVLMETTSLSFAEIAYAAGFSSIRQFNDTIREVYDATPTQLRGRRTRETASGRVDVRIAVREPFDGAALLDFLGVRAVPRVEAVHEGCYERTIRLPHGPGVLGVQLLDRPDGVVPARFWLADARDLAPAVERTRRLIDADADPVAIDEALARDPRLRASVSEHPGLRVPGHVDGVELACRAVLGQQVSVAGARTLAARLVAELGAGLEGHRVDRLFPSAQALAGVDPQQIAMPRARGRALNALMRAITAGDVVLDRSADRAEVRSALLAVPGVGPWTADYIAMRVLGDPDVFLPGDLGVRRAGEIEPDNWRPWRSYALMHLWVAAPGEGEEK
jgi:AraC family transcriptional regulator of adaptative response / DNA-3-methyladenine glycosylase II